MHERTTHDEPIGGPASRAGRRQPVDHRQLRSMLERSTGLTPQALGHLPGMVVAVLDMNYVALEISSTVSKTREGWAAARTDVSLLEGMPEPQAAMVRGRLDCVATGESVAWRYEDTSGVTYEADAAPIQDPFTSSVIGIVLVARDISDKAAAEHDRAAILASFQSSFQLAPIPQALVDSGGAVRSVNAAFAQLLGRDGDAMLGTPLAEVILPRDADSIGRALNATQQASLSGTTQQADARLMRADGDSVHCVVHMIGFDDDAVGARTIVQVLDQTERDRYEQELRQIANHDSLTGLLNRRGFRERVADSLSSGRRRNEARTLLLIDIDHFKMINDLHGHAIGDTMLRQVASEIEAVMSPRDPMARIAGDEFAVLCTDGPTAARACAAALLELVHARSDMARASGHPPLTVSIGLAEVDPVMDDVDDVLMRADLALYEAKEWGRDCIVEAASTVAGNAARRSDRILQTLRDAIASEGLLLHAQPIMDLGTRRVTQHEMLVRLKSDDDSMLSPAEFLPIAERHGLITEMDSWVARKTIGLLGAQRSQGRSLPRLHVNMSARSVDHPEVVREMAAAIRQHDLPAGHLVVELTETAKLLDLDIAMRFARQLVEIGCPLALDDFGAGFNSLIHLRELPLDYVKIDGSIARDAAVDDRAAIMVEGIASTARALGVQTVAEYVDTEACLERLGELGVDFAQGFQVGVPLALTSRGRPSRPQVDDGTHTPRFARPAPPEGISLQV